VMVEPGLLQSRTRRRHAASWRGARRTDAASRVLPDHIGLIRIEITVARTERARRLRVAVRVEVRRHRRRRGHARRAEGVAALGTAAEDAVDAAFGRQRAEAGGEIFAQATR